MRIFPVYVCFVYIKPGTTTTTSEQSSCKHALYWQSAGNQTKYGHSPADFRTLSFHGNRTWTHHHLSHFWFNSTVFQRRLFVFNCSLIFLSLKNDVFRVNTKPCGRKREWRRNFLRSGDTSRKSSGSKVRCSRLFHFPAESSWTVETNMSFFI